MPELFPSVTDFVLCALIVAGGQLIYAAVGFGAGMFSIALLAMVVRDLVPSVVALCLLMLVTGRGFSVRERGAAAGTRGGLRRRVGNRRQGEVGRPW